MTMKKLVYVLLFLSQLSWANTGFEAGNDWYKKGNYNQAILAYESVLESHKNRPICILIWVIVTTNSTKWRRPFTIMKRPYS